MAKKNVDRGDFDRFTSDGYGLDVSKPDGAKKKVVDAYNKKQQQKPKTVKRSGNKSAKKR